MKLFEIPMLAMSLFGFCLFCSLDAPAVLADFTFDTPTELVTGVSLLDHSTDRVSCLSFDGLEMYVQSGRPGGLGDWDFWVSRRITTGDEWGPLEHLGPVVNSPREDSGLSISVDGLTAYFSSNRSGGYGSFDVYMMTREARNHAWGPPVNLGPPVNGPTADTPPWVSPDGLELYFVSWRPGGYGDGDIYVSRRATVSDPWGEPANLGSPVNSAYGETQVFLSPDRRLLFFVDNYSTTPRPGGYGGQDIWMTRRANLSAPWETPVNLGPSINGSTYDWAPCVSPDGQMLYFLIALSPDTSTWAAWQAPIIPVVDFNGDGHVNGKDVVVLTEHWGESDSVCDIGPYAWGDGIVDEQDLFALAEYLEEEFVDPTLTAHWALDEAEGPVASDSAGENDAMVMGDPVWQPDAGVFGGALAFDGVDDFVLIPALPRLGDGPFSILAWVKGGTPDQVVISHTSGADWLYANPLDGTLMTGLSEPGRNATALFSDAVVTDGQWHRIGLVWDGTSRILLVDEQEVARDEQAELAIPEGSLMIGTAGAATPGRYFTGLIDDVRVYRRAVKP